MNKSNARIWDMYQMRALEKALFVSFESDL